MAEIGPLEIWFSWRVFGLSLDAADTKHVEITLPFIFIRWFR